jgi:hypothetical protein
MATKRKRVRRKNPTHRYKTESSFRKALKKFTDSGELVHWHGDDHGWTIETRKIVKNSLPRGKWISAKIRVTKSGKIQARIKR